MQRERCAAHKRRRKSFSTLYGSKWVATRACNACAVRQCKFQYPLRVEVGCNVVGLFYESAVQLFQYPLRVEVGCNRNLRTIFHSGYGSFSTLYGSKWVATTTRQPTLSSVLSFSTLYGSKWVATALALHAPQLHACFSTLYGSKWVATRCESVHDVDREGFSTLYGSKWVATMKTDAITAQRGWFQYPLRVEVGCNVGLESGGLGDSIVSVSSTGRSGLQLYARTTWAMLCACFSTLYGSKWVATLSYASKYIAKEEFQYPLRVEVGCN